MQPLALDACTRLAAPSRPGRYGFCALALEAFAGRKRIADQPRLETFPSRCRLLNR